MHKGNEKQKEHLFYYTALNIQVLLQPPHCVLWAHLTPEGSHYRQASKEQSRRLNNLRH